MMGKEKTQREKFEEAARELETDQSEEAFDRIVKQVASHSEERVFKLWPVEGQQEHRDWTTSTLAPTVCWVRARNAEEARMSLQIATARAVVVEPGTPVRTSPWANLALTGCVPDELPFDVPEGLIITEGGQLLEIEHS